MIRAYLFALDPTDQQVEAMRSHCGAQRVAYNWCLAQVLANWSQRAAEQTYGLTRDQLTPWINTSAYSLRKAWNAAKAQVAPWWAENSKEAYASGCANLATALGNRKAGRARMPRFKSKRRARLTCRFTTGAFGLVRDRRHVQLPVVGVVRTTGAKLIVADRWFASSKTCSGCGAAKAKLALSERTYVCMECGIVLDRDVNAAINLAALAADRAQLVREQPEGTDVRRPLADAVGPPREEPLAQPHRREMVSR